MRAWKTSRRQLFGVTAGALAAAAGTARSASAEGSIRMFWWGSNDRAERTRKAIQAFEAADPGVSVTSEFAGWDGYWPRLATQIAGDNAPDLLQMDPLYMVEYARRGAIRALDSYRGGALQIDDFGEANLASCSIDGKLFGINNGINAFGTILNASAWRDRGVEPPAFGTTWQQLVEMCRAFKKANKKSGFYAIADGSGRDELFEIWLRGQNKMLYTPDGQLGFEAKDLTGWFEYWAALRADGGCVTPDIQALSKSDAETSPLTTGYAAADYAHSNEFIDFSQLNKAELSLTGIPVNEGNVASNYLKPSQMFSVSAGSRDPETAVKLANFLVNTPSGVQALGVERGIPAAPAMRALILPGLNANEKKTVEFITNLAPYAGKFPPALPKGAGEISTLILRLSQETGFESSTPAQAADQFVREANSILQRR